MSYTVINFRTKKELKQAVKDGKIIACYNRGLGPALVDFTGKVYLEGPHYPEPHRWYASAQVVNGVIVKGTLK